MQRLRRYTVNGFWKLIVSSSGCVHSRTLEYTHLAVRASRVVRLGYNWRISAIRTTGCDVECRGRSIGEIRSWTRIRMRVREAPVASCKRQPWLVAHLVLLAHPLFYLSSSALCRFSEIYLKCPRYIYHTRTHQTGTYRDLQKQYRASK